MVKYSVNKLQKALKLVQTGFIDNFTMAAIKNFQLTSGIFPSGVVDQITLDRLSKRLSVDLSPDVEHTPDIVETATKYIKDESVFIPNITTDFMEKNMKINEYKLKSGQFINSITKKTMIFIHHTAGSNNPYAVVDDWNSDSRGAIGTNYVIGGINSKNNDKKFDGEIVRAIDDKYYAYHLGGSIASKLTTDSISIELCNFGQLTERNGKFYTYVNSEVDKSQVITLKKPFRGYLHWHAYSSAQILSLIELLKTIAKNNNIDIKKGLPELLKTQDPYIALELNSTLCRGGINNGIWSHTNVRSDKVDVYPHIDLMNALKNL